MDYEEDHQTATPESDAVLANYKSNELLAMLPNIETLRVMTQNKGWIFTPDFLDQNSALKLRKLQLPWSAASLDVIVQYLKFPKLDELHVSYTDSPYAHRLDVVQACKDQAPSGISQLFLRTSDLSFSDISMLLKLFSNLGGRRLGIVRMDAQELLSSPASVSGLLTTLRLTLVDLWLLKDGNSSFKTSHDGSRLDLSTFNVLKKLNVASDCFFADKQPGSARDGLWKLLPPRLEDIKVRLRTVYSSLTTPSDHSTVTIRFGSIMINTFCTLKMSLTVSSPNPKFINVMRVHCLESRNDTNGCKKPLSENASFLHA